MKRECHLVELTCMPGVYYSIILGYLQAAAMTSPTVGESYSFHKHVIYQTTDTESMAAQLMDSVSAPAVVGFSIYFWNRKPSLELARRIKEKWPACWIVVGGNDVSYQAQQGFAEAPWVDVLAYGEGENIFRNLLECLVTPGQELGAVRGISFKTADGVATTEPEPRIMMLDEIPSPLLSGVYSAEAITGSRVIIYETNRGCPFNCSFCFWGGATNSRVRQFSLDRVKEELELIVKHAPPHLTLFLADANFGMLKRDMEIADWLVRLLQKYNKRLFMFSNWAKNTNENVVKTAQILFTNQLIAAVTLSAQSFDPEVLTIAHRANIPPMYYQRLQRTFQSLGIPTYTELIWGLPGETLNSFMHGIEQVISSGGSPVIYPLLILNNTEYSNPEFRREHQVVTRLLPYQINNPHMTAEFVVAHSRMSLEQWLHGLGLRLAISLFYNTWFRGLMWYLHSTTGQRFVDLSEILHCYLANACKLSTVKALYDNYMECWLHYDRFDDRLIFGEISDGGIMEHLHYQAIVRHVLCDRTRMYDFLTDAAAYLYEALPAGQRPPADDYKNVVAFQLQLLEGLRTVITLESAVFTARVAAPALRRLVEAGQLQIDSEPGATGDVELFFRTGNYSAGCPFDTFILAVYHGSVHVLKVFEEAKILAPHQPVLSHEGVNQCDGC